MEYFVDPGSVVRKIWGKGDTILFVFAGSSAEFALNKAVDWLYFTGQLPADPIGRLFSTVMYARQIVFSPKAEALKAIDRITSIHRVVENNRQSRIPDWAYRDVLFMLIYYSRAAFEILERKLSDAELAELFDVFFRIGQRMELKGLPASYGEWCLMRDQHMKDDLIKSQYTEDLFRQYRKHLGGFRYLLLRGVQQVIVPKHVRKLLGMPKISWILPVIWIYKVFRQFRLDWFMKSLILPVSYRQQVRELDVVKN
jgi:hypothetical protein